MKSPTVDILGIAISRLGMSGAIRACEDRIVQSRGGYVCFANVHSVTESTSNTDLRASLNGAFLSVADGMPLVWASRMKNEPIASRVCGPDFATEWLKAHADGFFGFIGGAPGRAEELARRFGVKAICYSPPVRAFTRENALEDWQKFVGLCPSGRVPSVIWIGLGAPKQELWMHAVSATAPSSLFFGVGAAFDFLTGAKARAPRWMQENGLEWFYRLGQEPVRLSKRYFVTNSVFTLKIAAEILSKRTTSS